MVITQITLTPTPLSGERVLEDGEGFRGSVPLLPVWEKGLGDEGKATLGEEVAGLSWVMMAVNGNHGNQVARCLAMTIFPNGNPVNHVS
jgi:hypothetical protein